MKKSLLFCMSLMVLASCQNDVTLAEQDPASVEAESHFNANELRAIGTAKSFISSFASTTRSGKAKEGQMANITAISCQTTLNLQTRCWMTIWENRQTRSRKITISIFT